MVLAAPSSSQEEEKMIGNFQQLDLWSQTALWVGCTAYQLVTLYPYGSL